ncbi:spermatogenesis-associated protein 6-like isoform X3 [Narcine bancroftii]|uniref:spermatogenesis-associated protein 6-like isoform X3 n=1 Tax=Narcine bancroftii TaxID=1343680 RepID=UPI003831FF83
MPQKVLKCVIQLEIHAVTCPGVILPRKNDVYLSICILGQHWKTKCFIPVFPLLIHEKLQFEKVFGKDIIDPADVTAYLESNETLANYEDNTRNFLFPEPKLTPSYPGVDREVLMKRRSTAFLISPKLEFSTTTTITEFSPRTAKKITSTLCLSESGRKENQIRRPRCAKSFNLTGRSSTERKSEKEPKRSLIPSMSRYLPPYCRRCLLELCQDDVQHRSPLKSESISRRSFMTQTCDRRKSEKNASSLLGTSFDKNTRTRPRTASPTRFNCDVCLTRCGTDKSSSFREPISWEELSRDTNELVSYPLNSSIRDNTNDHSSPSLCLQRKPSSHINRYYFDPVSHPAWDRIHERVQNLLANIDAQEKASAKNVSFTCT